MPKKNWPIRRESRFGRRPGPLRLFCGAVTASFLDVVHPAPASDAVTEQPVIKCPVRLREEITVKSGDYAGQKGRVGFIYPGKIRLDFNDGSGMRSVFVLYEDCPADNGPEQESTEEVIPSRAQAVPVSDYLIL